MPNIDKLAIAMKIRLAKAYLDDAQKVFNRVNSEDNTAIGPEEHKAWHATVAAIDALHPVEDWAIENSSNKGGKDMEEERKLRGRKLILDWGNLKIEKRELDKFKKVGDTLEAMNYLLSCIVQELACICDGSDGAKQTAWMVVNEMLKIMSKREKEKKEGVAYAQHQ